MSAFVALVSALFYGVSDFAGAVAARRGSVLRVAAHSMLIACAPVLAVAAATGAAWTAAVAGWGLLAGMGSALGSAALFRGLAVGNMSVVAPVSALTAAGLPAALDLLGDGAASGLTLVGLAVAAPSILLVSLAPGAAAAGKRPARDVTYGLLAGLGFALLFIALGQAPATLWSPALSLLISALLLTALAAARGQARGRVDGLVLLAGVTAGAATVAYHAATADGVAVAVVLASLYPAVTVVLAAALLHEPVGKIRWVGLTLTLAAIALIAAG